MPSTPSSISLINIHTLIHTYMHAYIHTCLTYIHSYISYIHTCIHTHLMKRSSQKMRQARASSLHAFLSIFHIQRCPKHTQNFASKVLRVTHALLDLCMHVCIYMHVLHTCTYIKSLLAHLHVSHFIHACIYVSTCVYACTHMRIYTHSASASAQVTSRTRMCGQTYIHVWPNVYIVLAMSW
jgi:hypothetical protein